MPCLSRAVSIRRESEGSSEKSQQFNLQINLPGLPVSAWVSTLEVGTCKVQVEGGSTSI